MQTDPIAEKAARMRRVLLQAERMAEKDKQSRIALMAYEIRQDSSDEFLAGLYDILREN
jgi:hypothetical protein